MLKVEAPRVVADGRFKMPVITNVMPLTADSELVTHIATKAKPKAGPPPPKRLRTGHTAGWRYPVQSGSTGYRCAGGDWTPTEGASQVDCQGGGSEGVSQGGPEGPGDVRLVDENSLACRCIDSDSCVCCDRSPQNLRLVRWDKAAKQEFYA